MITDGRRRTNWKTSAAGSGLLPKIRSESASGFRIAHVAATPGEFPDQDPAFDIVWIRDDDSNFLTGVEFMWPGEELHKKMIEEYPVARTIDQLVGGP